jgi:hypothetical protein
MRRKKEKKAMLIISESSGMKHLKSFWKRLLNSQLLEIGRNVEIKYCGKFFQEYLSYLLAMRSSK